MGDVARGLTDICPGDPIYIVVVSVGESGSLVEAYCTEELARATALTYARARGCTRVRVFKNFLTEPVTTMLALNIPREDESGS